MHNRSDDLYAFVMHRKTFTCYLSCRFLLCGLFGVPFNPVFLVWILVMIDFNNDINGQQNQTELNCVRADTLERWHANKNFEFQTTHQNHFWPFLVKTFVIIQQKVSQNYHSMLYCILFKSAILVARLR